MATTKRKTVTQDKDELYESINSKIQDSLQDSSTWTQNQDKWHKLRMRIKKEKTFPFVGSSNLRMPTGETKLRKLKASLVNVLFGIRPVVQVVPSPSGTQEVAHKIEKFLDHIIMDKIGFKKTATIAIDQMLEKGFYVLKPYWRNEEMTRLEEFGLEDMDENEAIAFFSPETPAEMLLQHLVEKLEVDTNERVVDDNVKQLESAIASLKSGKEKVTIKLRDVLCDYPDVALCSPERIYVPSDSGYNPQECAFVVHEFYLPLRRLKENAEGKGWDMAAVEEIESCKDIDLRKMSDITKDKREGISRLNNASELVKVWEFYGWHDINSDGVDEKALVTLAPEFSKVLRKITLPYDNGKFPFVKMFYELCDDRWFSHRGIIEIIEDIIKEIDIQHMQKLDQQTIRNAPMFVYRAGMVNPNLVQFIPNQGVPIHGMNPLNDTLQILNNNNPNVEFSYDKEEQILEGKIQELIGQTDFTLQSMVNKRQPRTLGEVELQAQSQQTVFSLDSDLVRESMNELFNWIWDLWCQFGSDYYEFSYFGKEGWEKIRLSREEVQGKWTITVRGTDNNTNPQMRIQKAQTMIQMCSNPVALQMGVVGPMQLMESYKRAYQEMDISDWQKLVNPQPQPMPNPDQQQQEPPEPLIVPKFADLEEGEQAQVLTSLGIKPDIDSMMLNRQKELAELQHTVKLGENEHELEKVRLMFEAAKTNREFQLKEQDINARSQERLSKQEERGTDSED